MRITPVAKSLNLRNQSIITLKVSCLLENAFELFCGENIAICSSTEEEGTGQVELLLTSSNLLEFINSKLFTGRLTQVANQILNDLQQVEIEIAPTQLDVGMWHLPFVFQEFTAKGKQVFLDEKANELDIKTALKVSAARCSTMRYDLSVEKAIQIYNRLFDGSKPHMSPTEHQAKVPPKYADFRTTGITHMDRSGNAWSGNLKNFVQYRQLLQK